MNKIILSGKIISNIEFSHETKDEKFYSFNLSTDRKSGTSDVLPCIVSEVFLNAIENNDSTKIKVSGEIRARNVRDENNRTHLKIYVFIQDISEYESDDENSVYIEGYMCKCASLRDTPFGRRVADMLIACNRLNNKSDYIPCITWGRNAVAASHLDIGSRLCLTGRLQSRQYIKNYNDGNEEVKVAYEVSVASFDVMEDVEHESDN